MLLLVPPASWMKKESAGRPDVRVGNSGGYAGDNVYNADAAGQNKDVAIVAGKQSVLFFSVQNDGRVTDSVLVGAGTQTSDGFTAQYFVGRTEITNAVEGAGYLVANLGPREKVSVKAVFTAPAHAASGARKVFLLSVYSATQPSVNDAASATLIVR